MKRVNKQILLDECYNDLVEIYKSEREDGARWPDVETMVDCIDEDYLLEDLDVSEDALDLVATGEAPDIHSARILLEAEGDI
jgi:hypothetical protein